MTDGPTGGNALVMLGSYVERIEALETEKRGLADDIKDIYTEVKAAGLDKKAVRALIRKRREDAAERAKLEQTIEEYERALGEYASTPLGSAAMRVHVKGHAPGPWRDIPDGGAKT